MNVMRDSIVARLDEIKKIAETMRDNDLLLKVYDLKQETLRLREAIEKRAGAPEGVVECDSCVAALDILDGLS